MLNCYIVSMDDIKSDNQSTVTPPLSEEPKTEVPAASTETCVNCSPLEKLTTEYKQNWQRAIADYQNLQKETAARRSEWASLSEQMILEEFIPVYDNFKKAFTAKDKMDWSKEQTNWVVGIGYIQKQFADILKAHGVEEIKTVGEPLDTRLHEAVGEEEFDKPHGIILKEVDGGYRMKDRIIKVAKVIIAK